MTRHKILSYIKHLLTELGFIFIISPFLLYWFINGSHKRYIWIINGPYPLRSFGSGPFQMMMYAGLFLLGSLLISISCILLKKV